MVLKQKKYSVLVDFKISYWFEIRIQCKMIFLFFSILVLFWFLIGMDFLRIKNIMTIFLVLDQINFSSKIYVPKFYIINSTKYKKITASNGKCGNI